MEKVPLLFLTFISYFPGRLHYQAQHTRPLRRTQRLGFVFSMPCPVYRGPGLAPSVNMPVASDCPTRRAAERELPLPRDSCGAVNYGQLRVAQAAGLILTTLPRGGQRSPAPGRRGRPPAPATAWPMHPPARSQRTPGRPRPSPRAAHRRPPPARARRQCARASCPAGVGGGSGVILRMCASAPILPAERGCHVSRAAYALPGEQGAQRSGPFPRRRGRGCCPARSPLPPVRYSRWGGRGGGR